MEDVRKKVLVIKGSFQIALPMEKLLHNGHFGEIRDYVIESLQRMYLRKPFRRYHNVSSPYPLAVTVTQMSQKVAKLKKEIQSRKD